MSVEIWNSDGTVKLAPDGAGFSFSADPGVATAGQTYRFYNNKGGVGAATLEGVRLFFAARRTSSDEFVNEGLEILEDGAIQARLPGGGWESMTPTSSLLLPPIDNDDYESFELRILARADTDEAAWQILVNIELQPWSPMGLGHFEQHGNSVFSGIGDSESTFLITVGDVTENPGGADDTVQVPNVSGVVKGKRLSEAAHLESVGLDDASAVIPAAGEAFYFAVIYDENGVGILKGETATLPLDDSDKPTIPANTEVIAWGVQDDSGDIVTANIENVWIPGRFEIFIDGLDVYIYHGKANVANNFLSHDQESHVTLTDNATNYLYLTRNRTFGLSTDGEPTDPRAMLMREFDTVAGATVASRDKRVFGGAKQVNISFKSDGELYLNTSPMPIYIDRIFMTAIGGSGLGDNVSDIQLSTDNGATFSSIFASSGDKPTVASGGGFSNSAFPETVEVPHGGILKHIVDSTSATPPDNVLINIGAETP